MVKERQHMRMSVPKKKVYLSHLQLWVRAYEGGGRRGTESNGVKTKRQAQDV